MIKKVLLLFFVLLFIFSVGCIIVSAEEITTETTTLTETTTISVTEEDNVTLSDINQKLIFVIFGLFCVVGCLVAQGFSFWKW